MQAAFTKKTQAIAEANKELETLKANGDKYSKYEQYMPILEEMLTADAKAQGKISPEMVALEEQLTKAGYSKEAIDLMKMGAGFILNQVNTSSAQKEQAAQFESSVAESEKVDPRLNDNSLTYSTEDGQTFTFGKLVSDIVVATPGWEKDPVSATRAAIKRVDALIGKAKTDGKQELSASAKQKASRFSPANAKGGSTEPANNAPLTMREAADLATDEIAQS